MGLSLNLLPYICWPYPGEINRLDHPDMQEKKKKKTIMSCPDQSTKYVILTEKSKIGGISKLPTR
jgi:hypothetical protein